MEDDTGNFLGVTFKDGHNLLRILIEHNGILVIATCDDLGRILQTNINAKNAGHTSAMETCVGGQLFEVTNIFTRRQTLRYGLAPFLSLSSEQCGLILKFLYHLLAHHGFFNRLNSRLWSSICSNGLKGKGNINLEDELK